MCYGSYREYYRAEQERRRRQEETTTPKAEPEKETVAPVEAEVPTEFVAEELEPTLR
ncbi:hypothetical protein [Georgenia thermotolerans]|uniref:Uncharacterized protein n=1 Tax=Georgenia thermotolerans TaxID=527326 RepID=A0A7J5UNH6_9MICO|nr:hypothetical protein [Georgenia thermotolerans]KAE8763791.1 hypothetical protein GB883_12265 [Georgenia thermotolerans]